VLGGRGGGISRPRQSGRASAKDEGERIQKRLHQSQRLESLGELAGGIAHDFNNLLAVIINYAAFVAHDLEGEARTPGGEKWQSTLEDVEQIRRASERAANLTRQLLSFARRDVVQAEVIDVNAIVAEVEQLLRRTIGEHVELVSSLQDDLWAVTIDPGQLEQILVNLAINARDAMPDGGRLTIDTANLTIDELYVASHSELTHGPYVRLRIADTGTGMPEDVAKRAFDPFFTTKPPGQGTGLGLASVYGIVKQAGGHSQLYSELGIGTTFTALIPATDQPLAHVERAPRPAAVTSEKTILLVEDESALRDVTGRMLVSHGYTVLAAEDGEQALQAARAHDGRIDLLLTDVIMPRMTGPQLAETFRRERPDARVLLMSGFAEPILNAQGRMSSDYELLDKPFSGPTLLAKVEQALAREDEVTGHDR
jgi:signal transduction histidine kinase/ActR/RegA family two-component response regulator